MCAVISSPLTEVKAAVNNTELEYNQAQDFQFHAEQSYGFAGPVSMCYLTFAFEIAYLPWEQAPILDECNIILDVESPVPKDR